MTGVETVTVRPEDGTARLDRWFKRHYPGLSHGRLEKLLRTGQIRVDGKRARARDPIMPGQAIRVPPLPETPAPPVAVKPQARPQDVALLRDGSTAATGLAVLPSRRARRQGGTITDRHVDALFDGLRVIAPNGRASNTGFDKDTGVLDPRAPRVAAFFGARPRDRAIRKIPLGDSCRRACTSRPSIWRKAAELVMSASGRRGRKHAVIIHGRRSCPTRQLARCR
jgi:23S rRNA pseudouridine955/2504/2580 synthase